jgi:hypothetical protein
MILHRLSHRAQGRRWLLCGALVCAVLLSCPHSAHASGVSYVTGDVFAAVGSGQIKHFSNLGVERDSFSYASPGTYDTGMAFDASGDLYVTGFDSNNVYVFDQSGHELGTFGSGYDAHPESIVFDNSGNAYVGQPDGTHHILKFSSAGALLASYAPATEDRGTDWLDLAADQRTMRYTSEGNSILQFDVSNNTQLPPFATGLQGPCYAHRIRPNFEELVACSSLVYRLDSDGHTISTISVGANLFALNLDPDNKSFWTADFGTGDVIHVDIGTGQVLARFNAGASPFLGGLAVAGEIHASTLNTPPPATVSYYVQTRDVNKMFTLGASLAATQLSEAPSQDQVSILIFGDPTVTQDASGQPQYGATGYAKSGEPGVSMTDIATLVEAYAFGYYTSLGSNTTAHMRIVIGTNNHGRNVTFAHGAAWGQMVDIVGLVLVLDRLSGQVDVAGGFDAETGYSTAASARSWVAGYSSVATRFLYDVGDAGGCDFSGNQTGTATKCQLRRKNGTIFGDWTQDDVFYVSWWSRPSLPLPEIYTPNQKQAIQWAQISLYGALNPNYNQPVIMSGALTQLGACPGDLGCPGNTDNPPAVGWTQLYNALHTDARTQQTLPWSTDLSRSPL